MSVTRDDAADALALAGRAQARSADLIVAQDEIIHQATRLRIMKALNALPQGEGLEFVRLRGVLEATDGALGAHIATLERARYVDVERAFVGRKPQTKIRMSAEGRSAFARHLEFLRQVLAS